MCRTYDLSFFLFFMGVGHHQLSLPRAPHALGPQLLSAAGIWVSEVTSDQISIHGNGTSLMLGITLPWQHLTTSRFWTFHFVLLPSRIRFIGSCLNVLLMFCFGDHCVLAVFTLIVHTFVFLFKIKFSLAPVVNDFCRSFRPRFYVMTPMIVMPQRRTKRQWLNGEHSLRISSF